MSQGDLQINCEQLINLYRGPIHSIVGKWTPDRLNTYDDGFSHLERLSRSLKEPLRVGLLGAAGAGKSTLINALAFDGKHVLPVGGAGALTAQATRIRYSEQPYFCANYDARTTLSRLLAQLRGSLSHIKSDLEATGEAGEDQDTIDVAREAVRERRQFENKAALLIKGQQNAQIDTKVLIQVLDHILDSQKELPELDLTEEDLYRVRTLSHIASTPSPETGPHYRRSEREANQAFRIDLKNHAAGFLAPVVRDLEVGYPWALCDNNVELFDLPGVGVSGDSYATVTERYIRDHTDAVILVLNRSGILKSDREALEHSALVQCLLYSVDRPDTDLMPLWIVSTRADDTVVTRLEGAAQGNLDASVEGELTAYRSEVVGSLPNQLKGVLEEIVGTWPDLGRENADLAIERAVSSAHFHVVSSTQYNRIKVRDSKFPPFFESEDQTGIPDLNLAISEVSSNHGLRKVKDLERKYRQLREELHNWGEFLRKRYSSAIPTEDRIAVMRVRIRDELEPKTREAQARLAGFREVLQTALPLKLENIISNALRPAEASARRNVDGLATLHWASLRATVVKGGIHSGTVTINLPKIFSDPLEGQLIPLWQQDVLTFFDEKIRDLAEDLNAILREMSELAGPREPFEEGNALTAFGDQMSGDILQLTSILEESSEEIRDALRKNLYRAIREPILNACQKFVEQGRHRGAGTKARILGLFYTMVAEALPAAANEAKTLLANTLEVVADRTRNRLRPYLELHSTIESLLLPPMDPETVLRRESRRKEAIRDAEALRGLLLGGTLEELTSASRSH